MQVNVHGCRGSIPSCSEETVGYGGNTSCYEIRFDNFQLIIDTLLNRFQFLFLPPSCLVKENRLYGEKVVLTAPLLAGQMHSSIISIINLVSSVSFCHSISYEYCAITSQSS